MDICDNFLLAVTSVLHFLKLTNNNNKTQISMSILYDNIQTSLSQILPYLMEPLAQTTKM